jgi:hypothetical protein
VVLPLSMKVRCARLSASNCRDGKKLPAASVATVAKLQFAEVVQAPVQVARRT